MAQESCDKINHTISQLNNFQQIAIDLTIILGQILRCFVNRARAFLADRSDGPTQYYRLSIIMSVRSGRLSRLSVHGHLEKVFSLDVRGPSVHCGTGAHRHTVSVSCAIVLTAPATAIAGNSLITSSDTFLLQDVLFSHKTT